MLPTEEEDERIEHDKAIQSSDGKVSFYSCMIPTWFMKHTVGYIGYSREHGLENMAIVTYVLNIYTSRLSRK